MAVVIVGWLPAFALLGTLPSLLLAKPLQWAAGDTDQPVPIPAMGANVVWNLGTNAVLALALVIASVFAFLDSRRLAAAKTLGNRPGVCPG